MTTADRAVAVAVAVVAADGKTVVSTSAGPRAGHRYLSIADCHGYGQLDHKNKLTFFVPLVKILMFGSSFCRK